MRVLFILSVILFFLSNAATAQSGGDKSAVLPKIKDLRLQRSSYPAILSADCEYIDDAFNMQCVFFVSRVAMRKNDNRVNDMLMRMYGDRSKAEWQDHPICTAPEVRDIERHIRMMKIHKKISKSEEQTVRRQTAPAITFCADPTLDNYKQYLNELSHQSSCSISTSVERVTMRYDADSQSWSGIFAPQSEQKPVTEYGIRLDTITGQVGQRLIFMVTQTLRPRGGGRPQRLAYRASRGDEKYYCGYVDW